MLHFLFWHVNLDTILFKGDLGPQAWDEANDHIAVFLWVRALSSSTVNRILTAV